MSSNKASIYDGSVFLNHSRDSLDLSGWINKKSSQLYNKGVTSITLNASVDSLVSPGDKLMKSLTNELIGTVSRVKGTFVYFYQPTKISLAQNDYVHVYPKFEIVKIDFPTSLTYLLNLTPVDRKHVGNELPDLNIFAANADEDFGASSTQKGVSMHSGAMVAGKSIEGRFKRVTIDSSDAAQTNESAICYLKATPTII